MRHKKLGQTNYYLPPITFGAWAIENFGAGSANKKKSIEALRKAYELNYNVIDTAPIYGLGLSEEVVAEALEGIPRDRVLLFTKCGTNWRRNGKIFDNPENFEYDEIFEIHDIFPDFNKQSIIKQCEGSLRRLGTDYIDMYSLHWPNKIIPLEESMEAFSQLLQQGKIRAVGVCNHSLEDIKPYKEVITLSGNKIRYSMLNRETEQNLIPYCQQNNTSILAYSVLQRGILTETKNRPYIWSPNVENPNELALYKPKNLELIDAFLSDLKPLADDYALSLSQICLNWTINQPIITTSLMAATSEEEVISLTNACETFLAPADMEFINRKIDEINASLDFSPYKYEYNYKEGVLKFS